MYINILINSVFIINTVIFAFNTIKNFANYEKDLIITNYSEDDLIIIKSKNKIKKIRKSRRLKNLKPEYNGI